MRFDLQMKDSICKNWGKKTHRLNTDTLQHSIKIEWSEETELYQCEWFLILSV